MTCGWEYLAKPPHGPRLEPKVIWSERYFSANYIHKGNDKKREEREREREKDLMYFVQCIIAKMKQ